MKFGKKRSGPDPEPIDITERLSILDLRATVRAGTAPTVAALVAGTDEAPPTAPVLEAVTAPQPVVSTHQPTPVEPHAMVEDEHPAPVHHDEPTSLEPAEHVTPDAEPEDDVPATPADDAPLVPVAAAPEVDLADSVPTVPEHVVDLTEAHEPVHAAVVEHLAAQALTERPANEDDGVIRWTW